MGGVVVKEVLGVQKGIQEGLWGLGWDLGSWRGLGVREGV